MLGKLRRRVDTWWQGRHRPAEQWHLSQRNIYIVPTRAGLFFGVTLMVLLIASINYQLNLGYALTFLLAGSALASMHMTHNSLRGLTLHARPPSPVFAGDRATLEVARRQTLGPGEFYTLLPPKDDIHYVTTVSDTPSISIHLLANDTACVWRHRFDPASGAVTPFRSGYANAPCPPDPSG